jgi:predicted SnoaL-like aldol condensation-catalyzing enzyme
MIPLAAPQGKSNRRLAAGSDEYSHGKLPNVVANSTAEIVEQSETKLPDGTPAMEFVATWVTKQNARQTTQALTACKDGHAVTIATHTWEVGLPDKSFFFTLEFEAHESTEK